MKYPFAILFILLLSGNASAHRSMFGSQSTWWVTEFGTWSLSFYNDTMYVSGDTVANSLSYKKLTSKKYESTYGLMREDTVAGKVWFKSLYYNSDSTDTVEVLTYNFSLQKGDTFDTWNVNYPGNMKDDMPDSLTIVDTIYYQNGLKHIQFKAAGDVFLGAYTKEPLMMIEGIGSIYGVLWKMRTAAMPHYLLCAYKDGVQQPYTNVLYKGDCSPPKLSVNSITQKTAIEVYPNPATNMLHIKGVGNCSIRITTVNGVEVLQVKKVDKVDITALPAGVYFYFICNSNNAIFSKGKFVKY
jgi:hypothetical protein